MRILLFVFVILLTFIPVAFTQELLVRSDKYFTELFLRLNQKDIASVDKKDGVLTIFFSKNIKQPFKKDFNDKFIKSAVATENKFIINLQPNTDVSIVNDVEGIKIVTSAKKTNSDIFLSYGIGNPLLTSEKSPEEDAAQRAKLDEAEKYITEKRFVEAARVLSNLVEVTKNDFYKQEALYRLGQTYMLLSQLNDAYLSNAYNAFDEFARLYPDNFRSIDALQRAAEAKEKSNQLFEAINAYKRIFDSSQDMETKRKALSKIAELYRTIGQYEKAIEVYETYLKTFRSGSDAILADIGQIYYDLKDLNSAYERFSQLDIDKLIEDKESDSKRLFSVARTMEEHKKYDKAVKLYTAVYEKFPDAKETNDAIFKSSDILRRLNKNNEADTLLLKLKNQFPDRISGQKAAIEYAKKYLPTKDSAYWKEYFKDMLARNDDYGLHNEAEYLIIKSISNEKQIDNTLNAIDAYLGKYPDTPYYKELDKIGEDFTFLKASSLFNNKNYQAADRILKEFVTTYPESAHKPKANAMIEDIRYFNAENLYKSGKFKEVMSETEKFLLNSPKEAKVGRWIDLLDNASFKNAESNFNASNYSVTRVNAKEYLTNFPQGKHSSKVTEIFKNSTMIPIKNAYERGNYQETVTIFENNKDIILKSNDKNFKTETATLTGLSLYRLGLQDNAGKIYSLLEKDNNSNYGLLGYLTGDKNLQYPVNNFDEPSFTYLIEETGKKDKDFALRLVKQYTTNPKLAAKLEYGIAKTITGEIKRQEVLTDVYDIIKADSNARFDGSVDVFLDMGTMYFNKNDFKSAVFPLKEFLDQYKTLDDKRAEALYYIGASFSGLNDNERALSYYNEIVQTMPQSFYAGVVKNRIEDEMWKKDVKGR